MFKPLFGFPLQIVGNLSLIASCNRNVFLGPSLNRLFAEHSEQYCCPATLRWDPGQDHAWMLEQKFVSGNASWVTGGIRAGRYAGVLLVVHLFITVSR